MPILCMPSTFRLCSIVRGLACVEDGQSFSRPPSGPGGNLSTHRADRGANDNEHATWKRETWNVESTLGGKCPTRCLEFVYSLWKEV